MTHLELLAFERNVWESIEVEAKNRNLSEILRLLNYLTCIELASKILANRN